MAKIVRLTEKDLTKLIKRVIQEQSENYLNEESITDCVFRKVTNGELKTPPFDYDRFLGVVNDLKPVIQACSSTVFSMECLNAGITFGKRHTDDAKDLLPYITANISIIAPCFINAL